MPNANGKGEEKKVFLLSDFIVRYLILEYLSITAELLREAQLSHGVHRNNLWAVTALAVAGSYAAAAYLREIDISASHTTQVLQPHTS